MTKKKITFFTPYAGYTGSEMMLWYLICSLDPQEFDISFFALQDGGLVSRFPRHIKVHVSKRNSSLFSRIIDKILVKTGFNDLETRQIIKAERQFKSDIWYINTIIPHGIADLARRTGIPYAVHFHELLTQYGHIGGSELKALVQNSKFAVGCSEKVCENLRVLGAATVLKQYECVDLSAIKVSEKNSDLKTILKIPEGAKTVVMAGQRIDRKGYDLFIEAAKKLQDENIFFLWLGKTTDNGYEVFMSEYVEKNNISNLAIAAPTREEYYGYLDLADIFFLSSREDPFPLVMIEAGYLGKPILAFKSGGSEEFINEKTGMLLSDMATETTVGGIREMIRRLNNGGFSKTEITENAKIYDVLPQSNLFVELINRNI